MAKTTGVIGTFNGKLGSAVFANRRGINYARAYQPKVANPKTARQELSRAKMAFAGDFVKSLLVFVRAGWQRVRPTYEMQAAVGRMIPVSAGAITGTDPDELQISNAAAAACLSANELGYLDSGTPSSAGGKVVLQVTPSETMFLDATGAPMKLGAVVAVRAAVSSEVIVGFQPIVEGTNTVEVAVPQAWNGAQVDVFVFAKQIPEAINGIATETAPWKFPAACSACSYAGSTTVSFQ